MPAMILFKYNNYLTVAVIDRRLHKKESTKDVLEKVTLIKDINISKPHRAHIEILHDLSFVELQDKHRFTNFVELHNAWRKTLDTSELNKKFFRELANWYFWSLKNVEFPEDAERNKDVRDAISVIRMITRLIFIWFVKEKGLVPDELFNYAKLKSMLNFTDKNQSTYYKAILQNLFFATLNTEMNKDKTGSRKFRGKNKGDGRDQHYMIHNVFRYEDYLISPQETLKKYFENIPFLNGGLFECLDKIIASNGKEKVIRIDGFSDHPKNALKVPDYLFFSSEQSVDLNEIYGTKNKTYKVRGLIDILDSYKFTVDENTPIEEEIALDPELLGKVFENLLASYNPETQTTARKQTGSFYTPREIVNYMVDESIIAYLLTKLPPAGEGEGEGLGCHSRTLSCHSREGGNPENPINAVTPPPSVPPLKIRGGRGSYDSLLRHLVAYNDDPHKFTTAEVDVLIAAINTLKALDPACGSGAFPMGMLHKLVYVLGKLDPDNSKWREIQRQKAISETEAAYKIGDKEEREKRLLDISEVFENNASDYGRKLYLIENCIFGVDIQPIAVQIAKLRFFVSLIVDQRIDPKKANLGVRPLPNLETKFVAANTLIGIEKPKVLKLSMNVAEIDRKEAELKRVRERHFTARTQQTKNKWRDEDKRLRLEISELLKSDGWDNEVARKLAEWNPYDQNASADFFDSEWMFGVTDGFDVVIGNPPYIGFHGIDKQFKQQLQQIYVSADGKFDLYLPFIERSCSLMAVKGFFVFICPTAFTKRDHGERLRQFLRNNVCIKELVDFEHDQMFEGATNYTGIFSFIKNRPDNCTFIYRTGFNDCGVQIDQSKLTDKSWVFSSSIDAALVLKLEDTSKKLSEVAKISEGAVTGLNDLYLLSREFIKANLFELKYFVPCTRGREIDKYYILNSKELLFYPYIKSNNKTVSVDEQELLVNSPQYYKHLKNNIDKIQSRPYFLKSNKKWYELWNQRDLDNFNREKIITPELSERNRFALADANVFYGDTVCGIVINDNYMHRIEYKFLLAVLNSKLIEWYYKKTTVPKAGGFFIYKVMFLKNVPIKVFSIVSQQKIITLVDKILAAKKKDPNADTLTIEKQIDEMVYALYGLTPEEIAIVEGKR
ncbi:MAG: hypothetical protein EPN22_12360 [Nitrospirae bacterium]|nr:MAG: hypothetical protein EPN22_12360 [Nitrospirota bacterium]